MNLFCSRALWLVLALPVMTIWCIAVSVAYLRERGKIMRGLGE